MADELDTVIIPEIELGIHQHYRGKRYEVMGVALHSETLEPMVMYRPLYETKVLAWVRPYKMFVENVKVDGKSVPRFKKIENA